MLKLKIIVSIRYKFINNIILFFDFTVISENVIQISTYRDTKFEEKISLILYDAYLFKNYDKYQKNIISKIVLLFDCTSA